MYANQEVYVVFQEIMKETMATMVSAASFSCLELDHFNADFVVNSFPCKSLLQFREISSGLELDVVHMVHFLLFHIFILVFSSESSRKLLTFKNWSAFLQLFPFCRPTRPTARGQEQEERTRTVAPPTLPSGIRL